MMLAGSATPALAGTSTPPFSVIRNVGAAPTSSRCRRAVRKPADRARRRTVMTQRRLRIGLISDTHGLLRPQAVDALRGSDAILHAGDIVDPAILDALAAIAPVTAVRGNNDRGDWAERLPETEVVEIGDLLAYVIHDLGAIDIDPAAAGFRVVVSGHSHRPRIDQRDGVLYVNPGSAGPRRFTLPISVGELRVGGDKVEARLIDLDV
jgi:putative phosphoesterase